MSRLLSLMPTTRGWPASVATAATGTATLVNMGML